MNLTEIEDDFALFLQKAGGAQGLDPLMLKIFAITYVSPDDIPLEDLSKKTGYSLASISNKMKLLETIGFMRKIKKPGSKKVFVRAEKNMLKMHRDVMVMKEATCMKMSKELLPEIITKYKGKNLNKEEKNKLKIIEEYHKQTLILDNILKKTITEYNKALKEYEK